LKQAIAYPVRRRTPPGLPRLAISSVSSRTTRRPEIDVSGTAVRHSRVTSFDHVEHAEPPARRHLIMDEVEAPALVRQRQHRSRCSGSNSPLAAASSPDPEPFLLVDTLRLLAVDHRALPAQQDVQTAIAGPARWLAHSRSFSRRPASSSHVER